MRHDEVLADLRRIIARDGWAVRHVTAGDDPGKVQFTYTIGLSEFDHPEVVIQGMPMEAAHTFLNLVGAEVRAGRRLTPGYSTDEFTDAGLSVVFIAADDTSGLTAVEELYGAVSALQLVWPDSQGHLPWEPQFRNPPGTQPLLGLPP
jgi:hypothetical protein